MGLLQAGIGALGGVMADQWREFFYCESIPVEILVRKGQKRTGGRSSNVRGEQNIISNGSIVAVADGQCMIIVEQGQVVEVCATPGEFVYDTSTEPSIFSGDLGEGIMNTFKNIGKRFTFGGDAGKDQRVYYFNTKEIIGNKYGTANPVPFRVVDQRAGIDIDINVRCFGEYSYKLVNPILFYTNVSGNVEADYNRGQIDSQLKSELLTSLQPAFAKMSAKGVRMSELVGHTEEMKDELSRILTGKWRDNRGIEIVSFGMTSINATEEDTKMLQELQRNAAFMDPTRAAAHMVGAQASAMNAAANNQGAGPAMAFMGMNMAQNMGGMNAGNLYAMGQQQQQMQQQAQQQAAPPPPPQAPAVSGWACPCGHTGNTGKFCADCGKPQPAADGWTCACGAVNKGKFCAECGKPKPAGVPQYKCDKCGWEPADKTKPPKFCPECGDPFDDGDAQ